MRSKRTSENKTIRSTRENVYSSKSGKKGLAGLFETLLRKFRTGMFIFSLIPLYALGILAMGISAAPGIYLFNYIMQATQDWLPILHFAAVGTAFFLAYFFYGIFLIFVIPFFNWILPFRVKPFRGSYFSLQSVPWYIHNALTYIVRYTFLEFVTPTPINTLFYRMMGMKIGKHVHINTTNISDPGLIEIGNYVTIGGSAHIIAHYGQKGYLVLSRTKIGDGVNVGIKATIMGDVEIGPGAMIAPHEVVLPKSRIPAKRRPPKAAQQDKDEVVAEKSAV